MIFKTDRIEDEWKSVCDPRLKFILRSLDHYALEVTGSGIRLTSLAFYPETDNTAGRKPNSFHQICTATGFCEAVDINPQHILSRSLWGTWRRSMAKYLQLLGGVDVVIHGKGDNCHLHVELDVTKSTYNQVVIKSSMIA